MNKILETIFYSILYLLTAVAMWVALQIGVFAYYVKTDSCNPAYFQKIYTNYLLIGRTSACQYKAMAKELSRFIQEVNE